MTLQSPRGAVRLTCLLIAMAGAMASMAVGHWALSTLGLVASAASRCPGWPTGGAR